MRIKSKILFWFLLPSILIAATTAIFSYIYIQKTIRQNIFDQLEIAANELHEHLHFFLEEKERRTIDFGSDGLIREYTEEITGKESRREYYTTALINHLIDNKKNLDQNICEVLIIDFNGRVIASTKKSRIGEDVSGEEYFTEVEFLNVFVGSPHYDSKSGAIVIDFSMVLLSTIGKEAIGIIVNRIKLDQNNLEQDSLSFSQNDESDYSSLVTANKYRILDFSSDGFIRDFTEEIVRRDDKVQYYTDRLNSHLVLNKQPLDNDILATFIVDLAGKIISSTEIGVIGKDISDDNCYSKVLKSGSCVCELSYFSENKQNTSFDVARYVFSIKEQDPIAIIFNRYNGNSLGKVTRSGITELRQGSQLKGLGETGELYIVNKDKLMITESRFIEDVIFKQIVDTEGVRVAFENKRGMTGIYPDYRGIPIIGVSRYIEDVDWVVLAEKDVSEAFAPIKRLRNFFIVTGIIGIMVIVIIAIFLSKGITNPIKTLIKGTKKIANGDMEHPILVGRRKDEVKDLGDSFNLMMDKLKKSNQKNAELLLEIEKKGESEWKNTFDVITDIITIHDKDYNIVKANRAFYEAFNINEEYLTGKKCYEIFHGTNEPWHNCPFVKTTESLQPESEEVNDPNLGGVFIISTYPFIDEKGNFYGAVHQAKDITKTKKSEEEIKRRKEYTENLIETAQDAIVCIDEEGNINVWNQAAERIFGYSKHEAIGQQITTIIPTKMLDGFLQMSRIVSFNKIIEISGKTKEGTVIPIEMSLSSQKTTNGQYSFTIIMRDTTFQIEARKQLVAKADELGRINKELEDFIYIVAHDLKEPLFAIGGYTSKMFKDYSDKFDDKMKRYANRVNINIEKMSQKIYDLIEVMRAGGTKCEFKNNDSNAIIKDVIEMLEDKIKAKEINVLVQDNLPSVYCDSERMKEVFLNLLANAIKFMGDATQKQVRIGSEVKNGYCELFVEDTGIGIRPEYQERIFKIFKRLNDVEAEGNGVGLSMVKKIIELHNGKIWVESPVSNGKGSRFCFTIPAEKKKI